MANNNYSLIKRPFELQQILSQIPKEPGCYLMKDYESKIIYVGKSKLLRNRVRSYFGKNVIHSPRIRLMVMQVYDIEYIITDSESEALTLESNLIKNKQPYFNILLKDDKKYPYVCITWSELYPRIFITRRRRNRNDLDKYYGPYVDVQLLRKTINSLKRVFPLRQRPIPLYKDRTCLNYSIGRCPGVCQSKIGSADYKIIIKNVEMVFKGNIEGLTRTMKTKMKYYSDNLEYEKARIIRDQIIEIEKLNSTQKMIIPDSNANRDVIGISNNKTKASIQLFQMRSGKLVNRLGFITETKEYTPEMILKRFIEEHYSNIDPSDIPREINVQFQITDINIIEEWLSNYTKRRVKIHVPLRQEKAQLINLVCKNANFELERILKGLEKNELALEDIAQLLQLNNVPRRIEGYDISHIGGSDAVGSQVVFLDGIPAKQHYRKYKIRNPNIRIGHSDDYMSMAEVIRRRFNKWSRLKRDLGNIDKFKLNSSRVLDNKTYEDWPDLIIIDGGKGQLSTVQKVIKELDLHEDLIICSLAKRNEEVFIPNKSNPLESDKDQIGIQLFRRIRDEAHRFALSFHRNQRKQRLNKSSLSEIPGIGSKRIKILLGYFNSLEAIELASKEELMNTPGLGKSTANIVWNYFHHQTNPINN